MNLVKYDAARLALAAAHRVDEVKDIRDKAVALATYARQSKDREMETWVAEIRARAERRAGELLAGMAETGERQTQRIGGRNVSVSSRNDTVPTLKTLGISRDESSAWQRLAKIPEAEFEKRLKRAAVDQAPVMTRKLLRPLTPAPTRPSPAPQRHARRPSLPLEQALEEGRAWMVRWRHVAPLAPIFDLLAALIERSTHHAPDPEAPPAAESA